MFTLGFNRRNSVLQLLQHTRFTRDDQLPQSDSTFVHGESLILLGVCYQQKETNHAPLRTRINRSRSISYSHIHPRSTSTPLESLLLVRIWTFTSSKRISGLRSESLDKASRQHHKFDDPSASPYNRMSETGTCQQLQWKGLYQRIGLCPPREILT